MKNLLISLFLFLSFSFIIFGQTSAQNRKLIMYDGLWGYTDNSGDTVIEPQYIMAFDFNEHGIAAVVDKGNWYYIDSLGNHIFRPFVYDNGPDYFQEGLARYVHRDSIGFFDPTGKIIIEARFEYITSFHEGLASFCESCGIYFKDENYTVMGGNWGYINKTGKVVIKPIYQAARFFENGKAKVKKDGEWFFIDNKGNKVE